MAAAVAAPTPVVGGALERMAAAYAEQLGELDGWLALRTPDDNLEMEAQLGAMNVQLQSLRELVANLRRQVDAEKETVTELQSMYQELTVTCDIVTEQIALARPSDLENLAPQLAAANISVPQAKEPPRKASVFDGTPRILSVSQEEFDAIPRYMMKGRLTVQRMNEAVDALNEVFGEKYRIMRVPPSKMKDAMRRKYQAYRAAETEATEGVWFVTEDDIKEANLPGLKLDPTGRGILCMLRHLGRLQENRSKGITRFIMVR